MFLLCKYLPCRFQEFFINCKNSHKLNNLIFDGEFSHILFEGPSGSGKKTLIKTLLHEMYGYKIEKAKVECKFWDLDVPDRTKKLEVRLTTVSSNYHVELWPSEAGYHDKYVVQTIIKEMVKNMSFGTMYNHSIVPFKILIINNLDSLTEDAQKSLQSTMDKYSPVCRLIFSCKNTSRIIDQICSRCNVIRVPSVTHKNISLLLRSVCIKEKINVSRAYTDRIAHYCNGNLRKAILTLQACQCLEYNLNENTPIPRSDWEIYIEDITNDIFKEQTAHRLYMIREKLKRLFKHGFPPTFVISQILRITLPKVSETVKHEVTSVAVRYDQRLNLF
eukprot:gnl/TRDRNA2_/TRDRNA2_175433_c0_seq5.p1 gnl/TRDRNA2_/TRDRNA2_175433_c0~~gnl/TRDRNA2_/TRDRNA2_175433_c0_seq5.p1  ORF type:complete len:333 (+),score=-30.56 gnl/TRDRNA2_/TRDRNA2_175433_c0_seq5:71-1069(+)